MNTILSKRNLNAIKEGEKLLVGYLVGGYPNKDIFLKLLNNCETAGVDIFEIGFPSLNPHSDGEIIRNAHGLVDFSVYTDAGYWELIRNTTSKPIWLMGYKEDLIDTAFYKTLVKKKLIDALVIPDMNFEEHQKLGEEISVYEVDVVGFVNPNMSDIEIKECFSNTSIVYQQLYTGPTGMSVVTDDFQEILSKGRIYNHTKIFAGFGISTAQRVNELLSVGFDGVIVGTAMIKKLNDSENKLLDYIKELKSVVKKVGESNEVHSHI